MIIELTILMFWVCALSGWLGSSLALGSWGVEGFGKWALAILSGAVFGWLMADSFVRLPGFKEQYKVAPVNGATGLRVGCMDVAVPYFALTILVTPTISTVMEMRRKNGLPPLELPLWLMYVPLVLGLLMSGARVWAYATRDPAAAQAEEEAEQAERAEAIQENDLKRQDLVACAEDIVRALNNITLDHNGGLVRDEAVWESLDECICARGIIFPLPYSDSLEVAQQFLFLVISEAMSGSLRLVSDEPPHRRTEDDSLTLPKAIELVQATATYLRGQQEIKDERLLQLIKD